VREVDRKPVFLSCVRRSPEVAETCHPPPAGHVRGRPYRELDLGCTSECVCVLNLARFLGSLVPSVLLENMFMCCATAWYMWVVMSAQNVRSAI